jgi:hypothetical protein
MSTEAQCQPIHKEGRSAAIRLSGADIAATKEPTFVGMELSRRSIAAWQPLPRRIPAYLRITR